MRILVDMDDVLCEFTGRVVQYWNEDHPEDPRTFESITTWEIADSLGAGGRDFVRSVMRYNHLYEYLDPIPGAVEGMRELQDMGHELRIVTAIPKAAQSAYDGKVQWVRKHMPFFPLDNFFTCKKKHEIQGRLLLDDGVHNLIPFLRQGLSVCFDRPCNQPPNWGGLRVHSWPEFVRRVEEDLT